MAHEVLARPGHKFMSFVRWINVALGRMNNEKLVPMTGSFMASMDES